MPRRSPWCRLTCATKLTISGRGGGGQRIDAYHLPGLRGAERLRGDVAQKFRQHVQAAR